MSRFAAMSICAISLSGYQAALAVPIAVEAGSSVSIYDTGGALDVDTLWGLEVDPTGGAVYAISGGTGSPMNFIKSTGAGTAAVDSSAALDHVGRGIDLTHLGGKYYVAANLAGAPSGVYGFTPGAAGLTTYATAGGVSWATSGLTFDAAGTTALVTSDVGIGHHSLAMGAASTTLLVNSDPLPTGYVFGADDHVVTLDGRTIIVTDADFSLYDATGGAGSVSLLFDGSGLGEASFGSRGAVDPWSGDIFMAYAIGDVDTAIYRVAADGSGVSLFATGFDLGVKDLDFGLSSNGSGTVSLYATETNSAGVGSIYEFNFVHNDAAVPEPITAALGLMGLGVLGMATRRRVA